MSEQVLPQDRRIRELMHSDLGVTFYNVLVCQAYQRIRPLNEKSQALQAKSGTPD